MFLPWQGNINLERGPLSSALKQVKEKENSTLLASSKNLSYASYISDQQINVGQKSYSCTDSMIHKT